jgi:plasmid stability protein
MSKMIQIRNVPDAVHRALKVRAASEGRSLSDYLLAELERLASLPTTEELRRRVASREPVDLPVSAADLIRAERDAR